MRICVSGASHLGKSTVVKDFLREWTNYSEVKLNFRDLLKDKFDPEMDTTDIMRLIRVGSKETQELVRDSIIDQISKFTRDDNVIYDRGLMDNLMYSLYLCGVETDGCDGEWVSKQLPIIKESMQFYDIIFFTPLLSGYPAPVIPEGSIYLDREVIFRSECDNIFKALQNEYLQGKRNWLPNEECPAVVELFGSPAERIQMIKLYIDDTGKAYGDDNSLITSHLQEGIDLLEQLEATP